MMKIRKLAELFEYRAEGQCCGLAYTTELISAGGCSIHFWCGQEFDDDLLEKALSKARGSRDILCARASLGEPTGYWAHQDI